MRNRKCIYSERDIKIISGKESWRGEFEAGEAN
jgi:hypothetical protein